MAVAEARCRDCGGLALPLTVCPHPGAPAPSGAWSVAELVVLYRSACLKRDATCRCWGCTRSARLDRSALVVEAYESVHLGRGCGDHPCLLCGDARARLGLRR